MARRSSTPARGAWHFILVATAVFTFLTTSPASAQPAPYDPVANFKEYTKNMSFPERYRTLRWGAAFIYEEIYDAWCEDFYDVADDVADFKAVTKYMIAEAERTGQDIAADQMKRGLADLLDYFDEYRAYCGPRPALRIRTALSYVYNWEKETGQVQRLAHDVGGVIMYDFANVDRRSSGSGFRTEFQFPLQRGPANLTNGVRTGTAYGALRAYFSYSYQTLSSSASGGENGPYNMPGLGVGNFPNGVFTASNNPVYYQYKSDFTRHDFEFSFGSPTRLGFAYVVPSIGARFGVGSYDDTYDFIRPAAPAIIGSYMTDTTAYRIGPYLRLDSGFAIPGTNFSVFGTAKAGLDYNWAKSDVTFLLTTPLTDDQKVSISDIKYTPNLSFEGGINGHFGAIDTYIKGGIHYGSYVPNIAIPGGGAPPKLMGETATDYSIVGGLMVDLSRLGMLGKRPVTKHEQIAFNPFVFSDRRLKRDIAKVGRLDNGLNLYRYRYLWSDTVYVGVMAQEVALLMPEAVLRGSDGFLRVDYGRLGLRMMTWDEWLASAACVKASAAKRDCRVQHAGG